MLICRYIKKVYILLQSNIKTNAMKKYQFTQSQININSLISTFNFSKMYTTSCRESYVWLNVTEKNNYATLGYQRDGAGFISHISKIEANNLIINI